VKNRSAWLTLCALLAASPAQAWNDTGHMIVAAIAYELLTPAAKAEANRLLRLNPDYGRWIAGASDHDRDEIAFVTAATWPDAIKSKPGYMDDRDKPWRSTYSRSIGYEDKIQHRDWHSVRIPFSPDETAVEMAIVPNALTQIAEFRRTLSSPYASEDAKSYGLTWLLHIVGDLHQPLHAINRFTRSHPEGDILGREVLVCISTCDAGSTRLHRYWDYVLGDGYSAQAAIEAAAKFERAPESEAAVADEVTWAHESFEAAKTYAYAHPIGQGSGPYALTEDYKSAARRIAQQRAALAGARLASLLNGVLP
jgi:S1/P1 Nuclease